MEQWRPVVQDPRYEVSSEGRVRGPNGISSRSQSAGYIQVYIRGRLRYVHTLILEAFIGPRPKGMLALHQNDVKLDNRLANLRWGTRMQNADDAKRNRPEGYLTADRIRHFARAGFNNSEIGELLAISRRVASNVLNGRGWT